MTNIENSNILITGGTGSFGNRVAIRMSEYNPASVTIFSRDEKKQYDMKKLFPEFNYVIGDVRDLESVRDVMYNVDIVFSAAALKQVPSCELFPEEAIKTNTLGSANVCKAAVENNVKCVIGLSTDKAVKPINAMGMSKALMEKVICNYGRRFNHNDNNKFPIFCCVRYGNVMGSRGSVIPLFREQIKRNEDITVTVPEMTRFMLTLDDAVDLVLYAVKNSKGGEIFVKKAPACRIDFLAECMIKKYGNNNYSNNLSFKVTGIRAGEKLHETLINEYEMLFATDMNDYYIIETSINDSIIDRKTIESKYNEYTSFNTRQITNYYELSDLIDKVNVESVLI